MGCGTPGRAVGSPAGQEGTTGLDDVCAVDGLVAHGGVDVGVAADHLRDMRRQAGGDRVGDEHASKVVQSHHQRLAVDVSRRPAEFADRLVQHLPDCVPVDGASLSLDPPMKVGSAAPRRLKVPESVCHHLLRPTA
jgi:hypothetical protein